MSALKNQLLKRKKALEKKLVPLYALEKELDQLNKALDALEPSGPSCGDFCSGCNICRRGWEYR